MLGFWLSCQIHRHVWNGANENQEAVRRPEAESAPSRVKSVPPVIRRDQYTRIVSSRWESLARVRIRDQRLADPSQLHGTRRRSGIGPMPCQRRQALGQSRVFVGRVNEIFHLAVSAKLSGGVLASVRANYIDKLNQTNVRMRLFSTCSTRIAKNLRLLVCFPIQRSDQAILSGAPLILLTQKVFFIQIKESRPMVW